MDCSPLNRLPAELRNEIYELVLTAPGPIFTRYSYKDDNWICDMRFKYGNLLAITQTCKRIHTECEGVFFSLNTFEITTMPNEIFMSWLSFRKHFLMTYVRSPRLVVFSFPPIDKSRTYRSLGSFFHEEQSTRNESLKALINFRSLCAEQSECHFELQFSLPDIGDLPLRLSAKDLNLAWDEKLAKYIRENTNEPSPGYHKLILCHLRAWRTTHQAQWENKPL